MSFIDLMGNTTFTEAQLVRRGERMIQRLYPTDVERVMNRKAVGGLKGRYTPSAAESGEEQAFEAHTLAVQQEIAAARADNDLLIRTIAYEKAVARLQQVELSVGRAEVKAEAEVVDEFGVVITPAVEYLAPIEPLPLTIDQPIYDLDGNQTGTETIPNPAVVEDEAERAEEQVVINETLPDAIALAAERAAL